MRAVVLERPETLVVTEIATPEPGAGEVLLRVDAASICGSDMLRVYHGAAKVLPIVLGHEFAGEIVDVGAGVTPELIGQRAAVAPLMPCMHCSACLRGLYACCPNYSFIGSRVQGGFSEFVALPMQNAVLLPSGVTTEQGALFEPMTVTLHALARGGGVSGRRVVVIGVGSIGLLAVQTARWKGAAQIIAVDVLDPNLEAARQFGVSGVVNSAREDAVAAARAMTDGEGADLVLEVSGSPQGLEMALHMARAGGDVVFVGNQPKDAALRLDLIEHAMRQELDLHGAWMSYSAPFPGAEWDDARAAAASGQLALDAMFTHRTSLDDLPAMFAAMHGRTFPYRKILVG